MKSRSAIQILLLALASSAPLARAELADVQFFGDVLINTRAINQTNSSAARPELFSASAELLNSSRHNIVNLEGVIANSLTAPEWKQFLLIMPPKAATLMRAAGIDAVTLANNHVMDFGFAGLLSTLSSLSKAGIDRCGAGINLAAATAPLILDLERQRLCILAFSKTWPSTFWATSQRPGTAFAAEETVVEAVRNCKLGGSFTVAIFHWGREGKIQTIEYQRELAHLAIDSGADLVLGHHPHVVQDIEVYRQRPIFYSLGNFVFGTDPANSKPEGLAVRLSFDSRGQQKPKITMIPLGVDNKSAHYRPYPQRGEAALWLQQRLPKDQNCHFGDQEWACDFYSTSP